MTADSANLAEVLSQVARDLDAQHGVDKTLQGIIRGSVETVPGADYAGILLVTSKRQVHHVAQTDQLVIAAEKAQEELGEGPCVSVIWRQATYKIDDMASETRWPRFSSRALALGIQSMLCFQLFTNGNLGALNLYSCKPHAFTDESEHIGTLFASHAAIALKGAQQEDQIAGILRTRDLIGQAKGILMERHGIDGQSAFAILLDASQKTNVKLSEVARYIAGSTVEEGAS